MADLKPDDPRVMTVRFFAASEQGAKEFEVLTDMLGRHGYRVLDATVDLPTEWDVKRAEKNGWMDDQASEA